MEHPGVTNSCSTASGFGVSEVPVPPVPSRCLDPGGLGVYGEEVRSYSSSHPLQGSALCVSSWAALGDI